MNVPSTEKTEARAINSLKRVIDDHLDMTYLFNDNDKEMSWDGHIWLFEPDGATHSKSDAIARIPVQIKGHNDSARKYINKKTITYSVDVDDLRLYATEKGVVYFQIFIDVPNTSLFYISLFPSKLADYLEQANRKNKKSIRIPFVRLDKNPDKLFGILLQFNSESQKQGTAHTPLVENRIKLKDLSKVKEVNLSVVGAKSVYEAFMRIASGDACLYGKLEGDQYERPIQWNDKAKFIWESEVSEPIRVGDNVYYVKYRTEIDGNGKRIIIPSPNVSLDLGENRIDYKYLSTIQELYNDARFVLALLHEKSFYLGDRHIRYKDFDDVHEFEKKLHFIIDLYETLNIIDLTIDNPFVKHEKEKIKQLIYLINLRLSKPQSKDGVVYRLIPWKYGEKYYPLILKDDGTSVELFSSLYSKDLGLFVGDENDRENKKMYRIPRFMAEDPEVLANLLECRYDSFLEQINDAEINDITYEQIINRTLVLINVYDINGDIEFLSLAEKMLERLNDYKPQNYITLNQLQIKKRKKGLDEDDKAILMEMNSGDVYTLFGKYVLLEDKTAAEQYLSQFSPEEKERYKSYPIYTLFSRI